MSYQWMMSQVSEQFRAVVNRRVLGQLGSAFTAVGQSILGLTGRLPLVGRLIGWVFPLFGKVGAALLATAAGFTAVAGAAVGVGIYLTAVQRQTGALTPLFEAFGEAGKRVAAVYSESVAPAFRKFGDLMGGLFGGNVSYWSTTIEKLSSLLAERLKEDLKTPLDRFNDEMKRLQVALDQGHIDQEQFDAGSERAKQRRKDEEQAEYDQSPEGILAKEMETFGNNLRESTRTAEEKFEEQMAKIGQAFAAGAITAEVAQRAMEEAQKSLDAEQKRIQDEAERQAKAARTAELERINSLADRRAKVGAAIGGDEGQKISDATTEDQIKKLQEGGYDAEAFDAVAGYTQSLRSRAEDLKSRIDQQQESTSFTTRSAQEAMFGLSGGPKVDEQLLDEYKEVRRKTEEQTELLKQMLRTLED